MDIAGETFLFFVVFTLAFVYFLLQCAMNLSINSVTPKPVALRTHTYLFFPLL
jgi:hypothetical protein